MYPDKNHYFKQMQIEKFCFKSNWEDHLDVSQNFQTHPYSTQIGPKPKPYDIGHIKFWQNI